MTETDSGETNTGASTGPSDPPATTTADDSRDLSTADDGRERVLRYLEYAALIGLAFLALIAVIGAYVSATTAIDIWVGDRFESIFQTVFNLVVLGLVGIGISTIVRRRFEI